MRMAQVQVDEIRAIMTVHKKGQPPYTNYKIVTSE